MKKICILLIALAMAVINHAQTIIDMHVYYGGGSQEMTFDLEKIDSITFVKTVLDEPNPNYVEKYFSVSRNTEVVFSQGNLQYLASENRWRFARNQYYMIGEDNQNISDTYDGWIDLFGWGTGDNPTLTSKDRGDYAIFTDWGINAISNGGNTAHTWRTLTADEWVYLFHGRANAEQLFGLGSVNGVNGTIILPDDWAIPTNLTFNSIIDCLEWGIIWDEEQQYYYSYQNDMYSYNAYTVTEWTKMEQAGAVFLPAAGLRLGTNYYTDRGGGSNYWSATQENVNYASSVSFLAGSFICSRQTLDSGCSVRLVR